MAPMWTSLLLYLCSTLCLPRIWMCLTSQLVLDIFGSSQLASLSQFHALILTSPPLPAPTESCMWPPPQNRLWTPEYAERLPALTTVPDEL